MQLLEQLTAIHAPSGSESPMTEFILNYVNVHRSSWAVTPKVVAGEEMHDNIILIFGNPSTAIFAHTDSVGFTVRYNNGLVPIGGPKTENGFLLIGEDSSGKIEGSLVVDEQKKLSIDFERLIDPGTTLTFKPGLSIENGIVTSPYLDDRMGVYCALKVAEDLKDGIIVFSTYEEWGGGALPLILRYIQHHCPIKNALVCDITWVTEGVKHGEGVVVSLRDKNIPRQVFIRKIIKLAQGSKIPYQVEVEGDGSSDGREIHFSPYPIDWCFIGAPESGVHSPYETVYLSDLEAMIAFYKYLLKNLE